MYGLRRDPERAIALFRERCVACVVNKEQARALDAVDADGWARYEAKRISVYWLDSTGVLTPYRTFA
jgi:hypothetical protein